MESVNAITDQLKKELNEGIFNGMWEVIGEAIGEQFGKVIGDSLGKMISVGPFINFNSFLSVNQPSESQALAKIILEALELMEQRIIDSIEQQYVDEVLDGLDALQNNFADHNVRTDYKLRLTDADVIEIAYMPAAMSIIAAFEGSISSKVDNLHNYMLVNSLWIQMLAEDVQHDFIEAYGRPINDMTQQEIVDLLNDPDNKAVMKEDYELRLRERVRKIAQYLGNFSLQNWEQTNSSMFSSPLKVKNEPRDPGISFDTDDLMLGGPSWDEFRATVKDTYGEFVLAPCNGEIEEWTGAHPWRNVTITKGTWAYEVEGEQIRNTYYSTHCYSADIYNTKHYILDSQNNHSSHNSILTSEIINVQQRDIDFNLPLMIAAGYTPAQEMLDSWWRLANFGYSRPQNELDEFLHPYDIDEDGLTNAEELDYGTDPNLTDTDGDGKSDYQEIVIDGTDPLTREIKNSADISVNMTGANGQNVDGLIKYIIKIENLGDITASGVVLKHTLPANVTLEQVTPGDVTYSQNGKDLSFNLGSVAAYKNTSISITVATDPENKTKMPFTSIATSNVDDPDLTNNSETKQFGGSLGVLILGLFALLTRRISNKPRI